MGVRTLCMLPLAALLVSPTAASAKPPLWDKVIPQGQARFKVLAQFGGEAVLDKETWLVWERSPSPNPVPWEGVFNGAVARCYTVTVGGRRGWRLPTVEELMSLVDTAEGDPALSPGHPVEGVQNDEYWSITQTPGQLQAYHANLGSGGIGVDTTVQPERSWCVRGGHGFDAP